MAVSERTRDRAQRQSRQVRQAIGREIRDVRLSAGLSQRRVAQVAGLSQTRVSRIEQALEAPARIDELAAVCATLGLRLSIKTFPEAQPVRDSAQLALLERFRVRIGSGFTWRSEAPVGGFGDLRAWDVQLDGPGSVGIDAETRLHDVQALQRRIETKWRDSGVQRVVLLVSRTHHNTAVLKAHRRALASTCPAGTIETMAALRAGRLPTRNGIVII